MIYEWGSRSFGVSAQIVGETVVKLADKNGGVCPPSALVQRARPDRSPLHGLFTWDDARAAEAWRRQEARLVINSLQITMTDNDDRAKSPPAFIHVNVVGPDGPREGYAPFDVVVGDDDLRAQALREALAALHGFRRRYEHIKELRPVLDAIAALDLEPVEQKVA